jgi:predicted nucleotidyltransferase component of viral defense system
VTTLRTRLKEAARLTGLAQVVIERDYAQSYILQGIGQSSTLSSSLVFKGGTALRKAYFSDYRFSEDLDFSGENLPASEDLERAVVAAVEDAQRAVQQHGGVRFVVERIDTSGHPRGQEAFKVRAQFPWHREPMVNVKLEITRDEPVLLPALIRPISHGYGESLEASARTYDLAEICAEKLRATRQTLAHLELHGWARSRGRDFYDLWHIVKVPIDWAKVSSILAHKCKTRDVAISTLDDVFEPQLLERVRREWTQTLGPFIRPLPDVDTVLLETRESLETLLVL